MAYTAIDDSRSVIQHYGKKGMKWRKNRIENYDVDAVDVASADDLHKDDADLAYIKSVKDTQALNGPADYKTLEKIHGKNKVTPEILKKFQKNAYGKLIDQKVKSRTDRWTKLRDKARKINKQSTLNVGNGSPRI